MTFITIEKDNQQIRINSKHAHYSQEIRENFDFYFNAVEHQLIDGTPVVNYSNPLYHKVVGFDQIEVHVPSIIEPLRTTEQYMKFAQLKPGDTVLDLGAYSGLSSMVFASAVGPTGRVIAVEADSINHKSCEINFKNFFDHNNIKIDAVNCAVWTDNNGLEFNTEGAMGSAFSGQTSRREFKTTVDTITLSSLAHKFNLEKIDFIKCDVEGAEKFIFNDLDFFKNYSPKIIVELHINSFSQCHKSLEDVGYTCKVVNQEGSRWPLLECIKL